MKFLVAICLTAMATTSNAQDSVVDVTIGLGAQTAPTYFGSDSVQVSPTGSFDLNELNFGPIDRGGNGVADGFGFKPSLRYIQDRSSDDYSELTGLDDVDAAFELGGGLTYTDQPDGTSRKWGSYLFVEARYGVIGHESVVGAVGGDLIYAPSSQWELRAGPRLFGADDDYAATYFGVTGAEAAASGLSAFDPSGGILSRGAAASASYDFNDTWGITGAVVYEDFIQDAGESPIVQQGSSDQMTISVIVTRALEFRF